MAVKLCRAALFAFALVSLGSCQVFQFILGSVFPSTVTLLKGQANLSSAITASEAHSFRLRSINAGGTVYVVLSGTTAADGNIMMFFDADLNSKLKVPFTLGQQLGVFADGSGQVVAGNKIFSQDLSTSSTFSSAVVSAGPGLGVDGFLAGNVSPVDVIINSAGPSLTLQYQTFTDPVTASQTLSTPVVVTLSANPSNSNLQILAVLDDGNPTGNVVVVMGTQRNNGNQPPGTSYFLTIAKTAFASGGVPTNLEDTAPHRDGLEPTSFGFEDGKIIAYDTASSGYVRIDPATADTVGSFYSHIDPQDVLFSYPPSSGSFYTFDPNSRVLSKYSKWW